MKHFRNITAAAALVVLALPAYAQVVVSYVGSSSGDIMPGSATDFFFPNFSNYPGQPNSFSNQNNGTTSSQLTSFSIVGGVNGVNGVTGFSSIVTPAGGAPILTGDIEATGGAGDTPTASMAFEPGLGGSLSTDSNFNAHFNYNDFNVFLMYSNTGAVSSGVLDTVHQDLSISLAPILLTGASEGNTATILLNGVQAPLDTNTNPNVADYVEFNVQGLGTAMQSNNNLAFVVSSLDTGNVAYIGAVSFESVAVPEPKTWALLFGGVGLLLALQRLRGKLSL